MARLVILFVLLLAAPAAGAPGRVVFGVGKPAPARDVDQGGAFAAVALPDGGAILMGNESRKGAVLAALRRDGSLDPRFGSGGVAHVAGDFSPSQLLRRPDGRLLVVGTRAVAEDRYELARMVVMQLTPDGRLDPGFGQGGLAEPGMQVSCCEPLALQADGSILAAGQTGRGEFRGVVARLSPGGALDTSFGEGGIREIPGATGQNAGVYEVKPLPDGRIVVLARGGEGMRLTALTPDGAVDPAFDVVLPVPYAFQMLVHDGRVEVVGAGKLLRYSAADGAFAGSANADTSEQILAAPDGGTFLYSDSYLPRPPSRPSFVLRHVGVDGRVRGTVAPSLGFGGGMASFRRSSVVRPLAQDGFHPATIIAHADGSYLVVGSVTVVRYTGEGTGFSTGLFAAVGLTPGLAVDTAFGGPAVPARMSLRMRGRRARITASGPGLALIRLRDGRGRVLAQSLEPVYRAGTTTVTIPLTKAGRLARGRASVIAEYTFRDVLANRDAGSVRATL
jgi:uncharacterized delta-60 repeat protein